MMLPIRAGKKKLCEERTDQGGCHQDFVERIHRTGDDMGEVSDTDQIGDDDDNGHAPGFREGHQPYHQGDQPAGENRTEEGVQEAVGKAVPGDGEQFGIKSEIRMAQTPHQQGKQKRPAQVGGQYHGPEMQHFVEDAFLGAAQKGQHRSNRIFGEQLLTTQYHDEKTHAVTEL